MLLVPGIRVSDLVDLGWGLRFAFLVGSEVLMLLVWGPHLENY